LRQFVHRRKEQALKDASPSYKPLEEMTKNKKTQKIEEQKKEIDELKLAISKIIS
jgi:hypothetical protein